MGRLADLVSVGLLAALACGVVFALVFAALRVFDRVQLGIDAWRTLREHRRRAGAKPEHFVVLQLGLASMWSERVRARIEPLAPEPKFWACHRADHGLGTHETWSDARSCDYFNSVRDAGVKRAAAIGPAARAMIESAPERPARKGPNGWPPQHVEGLGP